jgi:hypothetical protein
MKPVTLKLLIAGNQGAEMQLIYDKNSKGIRELEGNLHRPRTPKHVSVMGNRRSEQEGGLGSNCSPVE